MIAVSTSQVHMAFMDTSDSGAGHASQPGHPSAAAAGHRTDSPRIPAGPNPWRMLPVEERDKAIPVVNRVSSGIHIPVTHYPAHPQPAGKSLPPPHIVRARKAMPLSDDLLLRVPLY